MRLDGFAARSAVPPIAVILSSNEAASAIAHRLFQGGWSVVLSRDPMVPVLRRRMSFDDAFCDRSATLEGVAARRVESLGGLIDSFVARQFIAVTSMDLGELLCLGSVEAIVDARMQRHRKPCDVRALARVTVGVGPGFCAGRDVHVAVETVPGAAGIPVFYGTTAPPTGIPETLGGAGVERFAPADRPGSWRPRVDFGWRVGRGDVVGDLAGRAIRAPLSGHIRGLVRRETRIDRGVRLVEIDPRGAGAVWSGIGPRASRIAAGTVSVLQAYQSFLGVTAWPRVADIA